MKKENCFRLSMRACMTALLMLFAVAIHAQNVTVKGSVTDTTGETIIGATVKVQGSTTGVVTDIDGQYTISVPSNGKLEFSYIGYQTQVVPVDGKTTVDVVMKDDAMQVDEVVVTALGIKRQARSLGYSTTQVKGEDFQLARDPNIGNALSGKIAGVSVAGNATGSTGSSRVIIRGNASLTGNNMPLYIVDGVPFDNSNQGSAGTWGGADMGDGLSNINADDIESIQVLKGAAASALYGYRGGNGVILITTKSGQKNKPTQVEVNENLTFNSIYDYRDWQDTFGAGTMGIKPTDAVTAADAETSSWGARMDGSEAVNFLGNKYAYSPIDNWSNFYKTGVTTNTSASVSGASDKVTYRFGASLNRESSILPNANNRQLGFNMNTTYDITKRLHLNVTANYVFDKAQGRSNLSDGNGNTNASLLHRANSFDVRWLEGTSAGWGTWDGSKVTGNDLTAGQELIGGTNVYFNNPYWLQYRKTNNTNRNRLTGAINLRWDITDWLYAQGAIQRDGYNLEYKQVQPIGAAADPKGFMAEYEKNFEEVNYNFLIGANKQFGDFSVGATFGGNKQADKTTQYTVTDGGRPFVVDGLWSVNNLEDKRPAKSLSRYQVQSLYGTVDLGWRNQLFLNLTARNDWFSTLADDSNSYFYPSVTASWVFTDTFEMPEWFEFGKVRAGMASASNGTSPYQNILLYQLRNYTVNGQMVATQNNGNKYPNAGLKPVKISEFEVGLNLAFLQNRLSFDLAYYIKNTKDDIAVVSTSNTSGYSSKVANVGEIRNNGFEFMVDAYPVKTKDFLWNTTLNFAYNNSEVKFLGEGVDRLSIDGASSRQGGVTVYNVVGQPYGELIGYKYKRDAQGNKVLVNGLPQHADEQESLGNGVYKLTGGWRNAFTYKDFTLAFLIDFKFGAKIFSGTNLNLYSNGLHKNTLYGREDNPTADFVFPGVNEDGSQNTTAVAPEKYYQAIASNNIAEEFIYKADFVKLRELSLGYNVPTKFLPTDYIKGLNVSVVARNLWTIKKYTDNIDPESSINNTNGQGLELNGYPTTRNIGFNVNVKF